MAKGGLLGSATSDDSDNENEGLPTSELKVNQEYARRFEHNKEREELQQCESSGY